jgi:hypothetical protein
MDPHPLFAITHRDTTHRSAHVRHAAFAWLIAAASMFSSCFALAAPVTPAGTLAVPNGDFSQSANTGTIGGGILGGSGTQTFGTGPWSGTYAGALGLLVPPTLTISNGKATVGGLAGVSVAGIVNNSGRFHQDTGIAFQPNQRYTLTVDVDAGTTLGLSLLTSGNAGIALATGSSTGSRVASSRTAGLANLELISGTAYRMTINHTTGASVSGNINIHLFTEPTGLLSANLIGGLSFSNVRLSSRLANQVPAALQAGNPGPYVAVVSQAVAPALSVVVLDAQGDPIPGVSVHFDAPTSGASATFSPNPAVTDANGVAQVVTTANTIAGTYDVTASVSGLNDSLTFPLTNVAGEASAVGNISGSGQGAVSGNPFKTPLSLQALDAYGNPVPGVPVSFVAPADGATAIIKQTTVVTDEDGYAETEAIAGGTAGGYEIAIVLPKTGVVAEFALINLLDPTIISTEHGGSGQNAGIAELYTCALLVRVADVNDNPLPNLAVQFTAPSEGASAVLSNGEVSGFDVEAFTDADGFAFVEATANDIEGVYEVLAQLKYSLNAPVIFRLRNLGPNDPMFANGFDGPCIPAIGTAEVTSKE